jgi:hypothetical protein
MAQTKTRVGLYLDADVARTLRVTAAVRGTTVTELVSEALLAWTRAQPEAKRAAARRQGAKSP